MERLVDVYMQLARLPAPSNSAEEMPFPAPLRRQLKHLDQARCSAPHEHAALQAAEPCRAMPCPAVLRRRAVFPPYST
jgi:hypothetical protein